MNACTHCKTFAGCSRHHRYKCKGCKRVVSWSNGSDDNMPDHCDDCWGKAHAAAVEGSRE